MAVKDWKQSVGLVHKSPAKAANGTSIEFLMKIAHGEYFFEVMLIKIVLLEHNSFCIPKMFSIYDPKEQSNKKYTFMAPMISLKAPV